MPRTTSTKASKQPLSLPPASKEGWQVLCGSKELADDLQGVLRATSSKATLPILKNVKVEASNSALALTATDMTLSAKTVLPASVDGQGATTVEARMLHEIVRSFEQQEVTLTLEGEQLVLRSGFSEHTLPTISADEFPVIPEVTEGQGFVLKLAAFQRLIRCTAFAASSDPSSGVCQGVFVEGQGDKVTFVATDTHRLALAKATLTVPLSESVNAIIPASVLKDAERLMDADVSLLFDSVHAQFEGEWTRLIALRLQGSFPDYKKVMPKRFASQVQAPTQDFLQALRRLAIHAPSHGQRVVLHIGSEKMTLTAESPEGGRGKDEVPVVLVGEPITIAFQATYLTDFLSACDCQTVLMSLNETHQAVMLQPVKEAGRDDEGLELSYVLMPMQLPENISYGGEKL